MGETETNSFYNPPPSTTTTTSSEDISLIVQNLWRKGMSEWRVLLGNVGFCSNGRTGVSGRPYCPDLTKWVTHPNSSSQTFWLTTGKLWVEVVIGPGECWIQRKLATPEGHDGGSNQNQIELVKVKPHFWIDPFVKSSRGSELRGGQERMWGYWNEEIYNFQSILLRTERQTTNSQTLFYNSQNLQFRIWSLNSKLLKTCIVYCNRLRLA